MIERNVHSQKLRCHVKSPWDVEQGTMVAKDNLCVQKEVVGTGAENLVLNGNTSTGNKEYTTLLTPTGLLSQYCDIN